MTLLLHSLVCVLETSMSFSLGASLGASPVLVQSAAGPLLFCCDLVPVVWVAARQEVTTFNPSVHFAFEIWGGMEKVGQILVFTPN